MIPPATVVATAAAAAMGNPAMAPQLTILVGAILDAVKQAELQTGTVVVPISGPAGTTPAVGAGPILR